jgi:hypothetical protein
MVYNHEKKVEKVAREIEFFDKQRRRLLRLIDAKGGYGYRYNVTNEEKRLTV